MITSSQHLALGRIHSQLHRACSSVLHRGWRASAARAQPPVVDFRADALPAQLNKPFVLVADTLLPQAARDSGSQRMQNLLEILLAHGQTVVFMADDGLQADDAQALYSLQALGIYVLCGSAQQRLAWLQQNAAQLKTALLSRHHVAGHWLPTLRKLNPAAFLVFDSVDLHFLREQREAQTQGRWALMQLARWTKQRECQLAKSANQAWVVSSAEQTLLKTLCPAADVQVLSNIIDVSPPATALHARNGWYFLGNYSHRPNVDAVHWLLDEIYPHMAAQLPGVPLHLIGAHMPADLQQKAAQHKDVIVHGHVADLPSLLANIKVGLAPLRFGAGVKGKVNSSLALGVPMVVSSIASEGMGLEHEQDILIADTPQDFAQLACQLHQNNVLWQRLSDNGLAHMRAHFSRECAWQVLRQSLGR